MASNMNDHINNILASNLKNYTINALLGIPNPNVSLSRPRPSKPENIDYVQISLDHIRPIEGFTQANIQAMYQDLLSQTFPQPREKRTKIVNLSSKCYEEWDSERDIDRMVQDWFPAVLQPCVAHSAVKLNERFGQPPKNLEFKYESSIFVGNLRSQQKKRKDRALKPDWACLDMKPNAAPDATGRAYLVGEDKVSKSFNPQLLEYVTTIRGVDEENFEAHYGGVPSNKTAAGCVVGCLKQVGTYAWLGHTSYAFIITEETANFFRFFLVRKGDSTANTVLGVEYSSVKMTNAGMTELTMNRGLYALAMMAQNERYRRIASEEELESLSTWYYTNIKGQRLYFHPISEIITSNQPDIDQPPVPLSGAKTEIKKSFYSKTLSSNIIGVVSDIGGARDIDQLSESEAESIVSTLSSIAPKDSVLKGRIKKRTPQTKATDLLRGLQSLPDQQSLDVVQAWFEHVKERQGQRLSSQEAMVLARMVRK